MRGGEGQLDPAFAPLVEDKTVQPVFDQAQLRKPQTKNRKMPRAARLAGGGRDA